MHPSKRLGQPEPLAWHLGAAVNAYLQAILAAPKAAAPEFPWHPDIAPYRGPAPDPLDVTAEAVHRLRLMLDGIAKWQAHPLERQLPEPPAIFRLGATRVLDYGQCPEATAPDGPVVLVVPSLINRPHVLDLTAGSSVLRLLAARGLRPLLLDWGAPGPAEREFTLDDYIAQRLTPAAALAQGLGGRPPALLGYCMGGTIGAGFALGGGAVRRLVTVGAPWDFAAAAGSMQAIQAGARQYGVPALRRSVRMLGDAFGAVPVAVFQQLFALLDPIAAARKFRLFAALDPDSRAAQRFVALEDWLADGVPMAAPAAEALLIDWHVENAPGRGAWPARRAGATPPAMIVAGTLDKIAQPPVARALAAQFPGATLAQPELGHVGMIAGRQAESRVWEPAVAFLRGND